MTEGRQPFTAEIKTLAKGPSTYDPLENSIRRLQPSGERRERPRSNAPQFPNRCRVATVRSATQGAPK